MIINRNKDSHKGENGRLLIIAGSEDYVGSAYLSSMAALRTGIDQVVVATPEKVAWTLNSMSPDLITKKIKTEYYKREHIKDIISMSTKFDAILIGCGIGIREETKEFAKEVCRLSNLPKVIDADAIKALVHSENAIITPHKKELELFLKRQINNKDLKEIAKANARNDFVILLKGAEDLITDGERVKINKGGNSGMTVGGTGDVLAGITAGLLCQSKDLFESAVSASKINKLIGEYLYSKKGYSFIASDMINEIPHAILEMQKDKSIIIK